MLKERKIIISLCWLAFATMVLFGLLGGTPFLTFSPVELRHFYFTTLLIASITFVFWGIHILMLFLAGRSAYLKKVLLRGVISIVIGIPIAAGLFHYFQKINPPPKMMFTNSSLEKRHFPGNEFLSPQQAIFSLKAGNVGNGGPIQQPPFLIHKKPGFFFFPMLLHSLTIDLIVLILCELVIMYYRKEKIEIENLNLKQKNTEARHNQLKMQLQPHFLFNSLNTLRLLLHQNTSHAEDYLLKLSSILRYSTQTAFEAVTDVSEELKLCITYLEMQKVRFGDMLHFTVLNEAIYNAEGKLPAYSLQLLAENAIKHNALTNELPLILFIDYDEAAKQITVSNKISPKKILEPTSKIGLINLAERYKMLSGQEILVHHGNDEFAVKIKVL
jgi:hypothetical protein